MSWLNGLVTVRIVPPHRRHGVHLPDRGTGVGQTYWRESRFRVYPRHGRVANPWQSEPMETEELPWTRSNRVNRRSTRGTTGQTLGGHRNSTLPATTSR